MRCWRMSRSSRVHNAETPGMVNIHVTYNNEKRTISYQKGGDVQGLTSKILQRFSDVLPANVASESFKFLRYDKRFKDYAELENEFKFDDDHNVTVLIKETPGIVSIHVTYNDTKRIISYQKGGNVQGLTSKILQRFSDVLPANVISEQVKLQRYDETSKDLTECENELKLDDDHKVTVLIKEVQVKEKEGRTPLYKSISEDQHKITAYNSEPDTLSNRFLRDLTEERISYFKFHGLTAKEKEGRTSPRILREGETLASSSELTWVLPSHIQPGSITAGSTFRFWSAVSNKNGGVMRRSTRENKVICDGTFEEPDNNKDTHIQVSDVDEKPIDESNAVVLLFTDTNGKYAMKGVELGQEIQTEILSSSPLDINCLFAPAYYWGFTMLKHVKTGYYVGCDYTGKTTLVRNLKPNYPNPEILFIVNALNLI